MTVDIGFPPSIRSISAATLIPKPWRNLALVADSEDTAPMTAPADASRPNIFPSLCYDDAVAAIAWLERAFGFTNRLVVPGPDGTVLHSELSYGPGVIMVGSSKPDKGRVSPKRLPAVN